MEFANAQEVMLARDLGVIDTHALIKVRLPADRCVNTEEGDGKLGEIIETTYGRVVFNEMIPKGMDYYNLPLKSGDLASVISDCYQLLGRKATIELPRRYESTRFPREYPQRPLVRHR